MNTTSNKRIAKNTLMLYIRMFLVMLVTLYTSRVILNVLGVEDYGIYNIVGGVVVSFSVLSSAMSGAISRFITFSLGEGNIQKVREFFATSVFVQISIGVLIIICAETIGIYLLNEQINIPEERRQATNVLFQFSLLTFTTKLLDIPLNALIVSNERMSVFAYLGIVEVLLRLGVVFLLQLFCIDKLIMYGLLLWLVALLYLLFQYLYCKKKLSPQMAVPKYYKSSFKEMTGFASWNFIGTSAGILKNNGVDIIVNIFSNVSINAARGIALQVYAAITSFSENFLVALRPQIVKSYAVSDKSRYTFLTEQGARFSFYLLLFLTLPLILEIDFVLSLWLKNIPPLASTFTQLQLVDALIASLSQTLVIVLLASGKIRTYQLVVGGINLLNMPISYLLLSLGFPVMITYVVLIFFNVVCLFARLIFAKRQVGISVKHYLSQVVVNTLYVAILSAIIPTIIINFIEPSWIRFLIIITLSTLTTALTVFYIGMNKDERKFIMIQVNVLFNKFHS